MENKTIILAIAAGLVIFVIGGGLGVFYQTQKDAPQIEKLQIMESVIKSLNSKTISSITALGKVVSIEGNKITLSSGVDNLAITMSNNAKMYSLASSSALQVALKDIKTGDNVSINIKLSANNQLEGQLVVIIPAPAKQK